MSFWTTSDNTAINASGAFEVGGGGEPIPANTSVLACPDEAKWDSYEGDYYISLRWNILEPAAYKGRKVFHKLRVESADSKKKDKALRMLAAIDANAGGKLASSGQKPSDIDLMQNLVNKPMVLKLQIWEVDDGNGGTKKGNWVSAVSPRNAPTGQAPAPNNKPDDSLPDF